MVEQNRLEPERGTDLVAERRKQALDLVPALLGLVRLERKARPVCEELRQDVRALAVARDGRQRLLEPRQREISLAPQARQPPDLDAQVLRSQTHSSTAAKLRCARYDVRATISFPGEGP